MKRNKLFLGAALAVCGLSLASCATKEVRNTVTPYGSLKLDATIATASNEQYKMSLEQFYDKLRFNGYNKVNSAIEGKLYAEEFNAIRHLYDAISTEAKLSAEDIKTLTILDKDNKPLYEVNEAKIKELQDELLEKVNTVVATKIFSTAKPEEIEAKKKNTTEYNKAVMSFVDSQNKIGVAITKADVENFKVVDGKDYIVFSNDTLTKLNDAVNAVILDQAKLLSSMKKLYLIASDEYITEKDDKGNDKQIKNPNNILTDKAYENAYDQTFKTYGEYNAIVVQFNSKRDADMALEAIGGIDTSSNEKVLESYINLYKHHYNYRINEDNTLDKNNDDFKFLVSEDNNDFDRLPTAVATFVKDTLMDNEYLTEPRNINNKYVLVYKLDTKYQYHGDETNEPLAYNEFISSNHEHNNVTDADIKNVKNQITEDLLVSSAKNYQSTDFKKMLESDKLNLKIYDPLFEYKFEYANPEFYDNINETVAADSNLIFSMGEKGTNGKYPVEYTVEDFFKDAAKEYATPIITEYFQLEYANQFYDTYVEKHLISKTAKDDNKKALDEAIKGFNSNNNSTYPAEIGLETFLLSSYGYKNKDDVIKYYYDSKAALNTYISVKVYDNWAQADGDSFVISDEAKKAGSILDNILKTGNAKLTNDELFNINLDHFLINIDENGDGTPDDPNKFLAELKKNGGDINEFNAAVTKLAQAIIQEASYEAYKENTLFETLTFIKGQYEEGAKLLSNPSDSWDNYKEFNFLITVEQLASSGDITQDSVNNFVPEFKAYVENVYKAVSKNKLELDEDDEKGKFYVIDTLNPENGRVMNTENASELKYEELCMTSFGYHVLVVNSYEGPGEIEYTEKDDVSGFQKNLQIVLRKHEANKDDKDDKDELIYVYTDSYTHAKDAKVAEINQLFIYYVQQANGVDSSLDSDIKKLMSTLFDQAISTYTSSNFQTYLLLKKLDIKINDVTIAGTKISPNAAKAEMDSIQNAINSYDEESSPYKDWFTKFTWDRPAI